MSMLQNEQRPVQYLDTKDAYDLWSEVYDTDGNFLQAIDTIEMKTWIPKAAAMAVRDTNEGIDLAADLGCGTGRNTVRLLMLNLPCERVLGLELSSKMLDLARSRCEQAKSKTIVEFKIFDMLSDTIPSNSCGSSDLVISTLVLEHVPAEVFFSVASSLLRSGGILLVSNMHSDMGKISQAGFVDPKTETKVRPLSLPHTIADVLEMASRHGLLLIDEVKEIAVDTDLAQLIGPRGRKWQGIKVWFGAIWKKI